MELVLGRINTPAQYSPAATWAPTHPYLDSFLTSAWRL